MANLVLKKADYKRICEQALEEYVDGECCGMLTVSAEGGASQIHLCENIQQKMHDEDPQMYPRTTLNAYLIDPAEQYRIISQAEKAGGGISGFYHSHVDCDAYFSAEDKAQACALFGDEPTYPDAVYLVLSVYGPRSGVDKPELKECKCFAWDEEKADYVEVVLELVD